MVRKSTKTSSFGTSKREGHDASQFYTSNLYQGINITESKEIIDHSSLLEENWFTQSHSLSLEWLKKLPNNSIHLIIFDLNFIRFHDSIDIFENTDNYRNLIKEFYRFLVTGGRLILLIDNYNDLKPQSFKFNSFHACIVPFVNQIGFLMRGETIWQNENSYQHVLIFSKDAFKRMKENKTDSITRDQFLSYTKSIWSPNRELLITNSSFIEQNQIIYSDIIDLYGHIIHLYSFIEDVILCCNSTPNTNVERFIKSLRKKCIYSHNN